MDIGVDYELLDSSGMLGQTDQLRQRLNEDGFLFFRELIPTEAIVNSRGEISEILNTFGYVKPAATPFLQWSGKQEVVDGAIHELQAGGAVGKAIGKLASLKQLYECRKLVEVFRSVLGSNVHSWVLNPDRVKVKLPGTDTFIHQDTAYYAQNPLGRSIPFFVAWIPLMAVDLALGGLALERGSHHDYLKVFGMPSHDSYLPHSWSNFKVLGMPDNEAQLRSWLASGAFVLHGDKLSFNDARKWWGTDYRAGDVVIFHRLIVHRGLPNTSSNVRLSADFRYQRSDSHLDFRSRHRQAAIDSFAATIRDDLHRLRVVGIKADRVLGQMLLEGPSSTHGATVERLHKLVAAHI